jgi:SAM-dependent methyltransferase
MNNFLYPQAFETPSRRPPMIHVCRICANSERNKTWACCEKMFGWGDEFTYLECARCGCLQLSEVPGDLSRYYPPNYYSFSLKPALTRGFRRRLAGLRDFSAATGTGMLGRFLGKLIPARADVASLGLVPVNGQSRILDLGCGSGELLSMLHRAGFRELTGVDPFIANDSEVLPGLRVQKKELREVQGEFDLIMLHHVFEHLEFPHQALSDYRDKLSRNGKILLRFPTVDSEAWEKYRENWVQLDAPRHLFLHSRKSMELIAKSAGLVVEKVWCDSDEFQFLGSEIYERGASLFGDHQPGSRSFSPPEVRRYRKAAKLLNKINRGDQVAVVLAPI